MNSREARDYVLSIGQRTGLFESVLGHEPKAAPRPYTLAVAGASYRPALSGLNSVSMVYTLRLRIFVNMLMEPQDDIDPILMDGVDAMLAGIIANYMGVNGSRYIDVFGSDSEGLSADLAYAEQDGKKFRIADITVPVILNDVYTESA